MIKYFTIEDLLKHYLQKKFHILALVISDKIRASPSGKGSIRKAQTTF